MKGYRRGGTLLLALLLAAWAGGCDSSSGIDTSNSMLFGTYQVSQFGADDVTGEPWSDRFAVQFDGHGTMYEQSGAVYVESGNYNVTASRSFSVSGDDTVGVLNRTAEVLLTGKLAWTPEINISAAVRTAAGLGSETFAGHYIGCLAGADPVSGHCWTRRLLIYADGMGNFYWTIIGDSEGVTGMGRFDYVIASGELAIDGDGVHFTGGVRSDGSVAIATGSGNEMLFAVRESDWQPAPLEGSYAGYAFLAQTVGVTTCATARLSFVADRDGRATLNETRSDGSSDSETLTYTLTSAGRLVLDGQEFGIVSSDGEILAGVDTDPTDGEIGIYLGLKQ